MTLLLVASGGAQAAPSPLDSAAAVRAVNAWTNFFPGDDIRSSLRGRDVHIADLDGDGVQEIVYLEVADCTGANFDCPNRVAVMTPLRGDEPMLRASSLDSADATHDKARIKAAGYIKSGSLQIPGEVERLFVVGNRIDVYFKAVADSPTCKADELRHEPCPAPGRYIWQLEWEAGVLAKKHVRCEGVALTAAAQQVFAGSDAGCLRIVGRKGPMH